MSHVALQEKLEHARSTTTDESGDTLHAYLRLAAFLRVYSSRSGNLSHRLLQLPGMLSVRYITFLYVHLQAYTGSVSWVRGMLDAER